MSDDIHAATEREIDAGAEMLGRVILGCIMLAVSLAVALWFRR